MINKRSYFIGLGTGMLFSSFLIFITYSFTYKPVNKQETEKEVVEKARKIGMVFIKETSNDKEPKKQELEVQNTNTNEEVIIYVKEGSTSYDIALLLEQSNIIDSAKDFNKYIIEENASKKLNYGDVTLTKSMSYKEVFDKIVLKQ